MTRNQVRTSGEQIGQELWQRSVRGVTYFGGTLFLVLLTWVYLQRVFLAEPRSVWSVFGLGLLHSLLAVTLERCLFFTRLKRKWRYRLAFMIGAGLPVVCWALQCTIWPFHVGYPLSLVEFAVALVVGILGAFLGGLFVTAVKDNLWENNSPPSEQVMMDVYRRHLEIIGEPGPEPGAKRWFDRGLALLGLLLSAPVWGLSAFLVWFEDPGPILFVKNSVGKGGVNFHQYKFRTMVSEAENTTGPVLSQRGDARVLLIGRLLRKTALDELPQVINILRGEMSFVGPRPQRTILVQGYLQSIPEYAQRHCVLPGLAGLAQVAGDYYLTPRQKLRFDRLYIRHVDLGFDLKLLVLACLITFWFRWQKSWNGRLPRNLLRVGSGSVSAFRVKARE